MNRFMHSCLAVVLPSSTRARNSVMKLKHFNADFSAWEKQAEFVSFPLVKIEEGAAWFGGLTYKKLGADRLDVFVAVGEEGEVEEARLVFERVGAGVVTGR